MSFLNDLNQELNNNQQSIDKEGPNKTAFGNSATKNSNFFENEFEKIDVLMPIQVESA